MSFAQRREQVIGDLVQLTVDVDVHSKKHSSPPEQYVLELDFTEDVAEQMAPGITKVA